MVCVQHQACRNSFIHVFLVGFVHLEVERKGGEEERIVKYEFNELWRDRDIAYEELSKAILEKLYAIISKLTGRPRPGREGGRPPKVTPAKAAILAVMKEYHREIPYRELAVTKYVEWRSMINCDSQVGGLLEITKMREFEMNTILFFVGRSVSWKQMRKSL